MTDDDLFHALAEAHRERDPLADPRWEELSRGTLGEAEREALRSSDPEAYALFAPLDEVERAAIADRLLTDRRVAPGALVALADPERARPRSSSVRPRRWPRTLAAFAAAATLAVAASALLFVRPAGAPLPPYAAVVDGELDVRALPAGPGGVARLGPGSSLDVVLRPATPVTGAVVARAFLVRDGGVRPLSAPLQVSEDGAVRLTGRYEALFAGEPPGPCEIVIALGHTLPLDPASLKDAIAERGGDLRGGRLVRVPLLLVERR
jgi:hypothetical protein